MLELASPPGRILAGVWGFLVVATVVVRLVVARRSAGGQTELVSRINSWWVIVGLLCLALVFGRATTIVLTAFVSYLALKEYLTIIPTPLQDRKVLLLAYLLIPLQYVFVGYENFEMFLVLIPVYGLAVIAVAMILVGLTHGYIARIGTIYWGLMMAVFSLSHLAWLVVMPGEAGTTEGVGLVLYVVMLTQANDVSQYIWGKGLGGPKIIPKVSPGKTWAGFLGGVATSVALAAVMGPLLTPLSWPLAAVSGLLAAVGGFFGDLNMSCVKRDLCIKDTGAMLPGHGGILDRVDSLVLSAPLLCHFIRFFCYLDGPR
jgi:phosphatidate cytidylyltransferase